MKKIIVLLLLLCLSIKVKAQEIDLPPYVNYMADNPFMISSSYAGIGSELQFRLNGVSQWIGVKRAPNTQTLSVEGRIADTFGGGLAIFNDSNGYTKQQGAKLSFASHLTLSDFHDSFLSLALSYSYTQFSINTLNSDPTVLEAFSSISQGTSNFDVSMLYRYERFAISANVMNILDKSVARVENGEPQKLRKYTIYPLYNFRVNHNMEFEPSLFFEFFESTQRSKTDINLKLRRKIRDGYVWAGLSTTFLNDQLGKPIGMAPLVGMKKNKFYFSYGVGITLNEIVNYNYGTHMITLGLDYDQRPSLARCTRKMMMF